MYEYTTSEEEDLHCMNSFRSCFLLIERVANERGEHVCVVSFGMLPESLTYGTFGHAA